MKICGRDFRVGLSLTPLVTGKQGTTIIYRISQTIKTILKLANLLNHGLLHGRILGAGPGRHHPFGIKEHGMGLIGHGTGHGQLVITLDHIATQLTDLDILGLVSQNRRRTDRILRDPAEILAR